MGAKAEDLVFVTNATSGLNAAIRSLELEDGDEILTTAHEYGAIVRTWEFMRATLVVCEPEEIPARIGPRTRAVCVSHVTSPTTLVLPVEEICAAAREAGVLSIVDGAHAPGQIPLDLEALGADVYAGNCHKWLCAPKGAGFLWARPEHQSWIQPLVVSWGYRETAFVDRHTWAGTKDPSAYLTVPKAIEVHATSTSSARRPSRTLRKPASRARARADSRGARPLHARRPARARRCGRALSRLYAEHRVEAPVYEWEGRRCCESRSARTTTRRTWSAWSRRSPSSCSGG